MQEQSPLSPECDGLLRQAREFFGQKKFREALEMSSPILQKFPLHRETIEIAGSAAYALRNLAMAERLWHKALEMDPRNASKHFRLAMLYMGAGISSKAKTYFEACLKLDPNFADAHNNYGNLLIQEDLFAQAEYHYREALRINPSAPGSLNNLGALLRTLRRYPEAEACYHATLKLNPSFIHAYNNLGCLYSDQGQLDKADACFRQALRLKPDSPEARYLYSVAVLLRDGRFDEGWPLYEARHDPRKQDPISVRPSVAFPMWRGEPLHGKSLVIYEEQGFGDTIQFVRYAKILKAQGAKVITLVCRKPLHSLCKTAAGIDNVIGPEGSVEKHDFWTLCMSIPLYTDFRIGDVPFSGGYLHASSRDDHRWQAIANTQRLKVGLVWKGSSGHKNDRERSIRDPRLLKKLWEIQGVEFFSLQNGELTTYEKDLFTGEQPLTHLGNFIHDFSDTAACVSQLDLLISVDTAPVHVAGALGRPVWTVIAKPSDWRWLPKSPSTPWYNSMRLFYQEKEGDWDGVVRNVCQELKLFASLRQHTMSE